MKISKYLMLSLMFLIAFILIAVNVKFNTAFALYDLKLYNYVHSLCNEKTLNTAIFITNFGREYLSILFPTILITLLFKKYFKEALLVILSNTGDALNILLKILFARPRLNTGIYTVIFSGYSFPSGHTVASVCFYGILIYLSSVYIRRTWLKFLINLISVLIILTVGFTRVYIGAHYPSDVIGGYCFALFWLFICIYIYEKFILSLIRC